MLRTIIITLLLVALIGCEKKQEKIDIGYIGTLSGRYSDLGQGTLQGVVLAVEQSDIAERINLIVKDDFGRPAEGARISADLAEDGVRYVIGPNLSSVATASVSTVNSKGIYMLSPTTSTSALAGKRDNFVRTMPHNSYKQAEVISRYLINDLGYKDIVVLYDSRNSSYSSDIVKKFSEAYMSNGGEIKDVRSFDPDTDESLSSLLADDVDDPPSLYYIIGSAMDSSLLIWQIRKKGFKSKILIRKWAASNDFFRLGGDAVDGVMVFDYYINKKTPEYLNFYKNYKARFQKEPSWMSVYGYEAARMLIESMDDIHSGAGFTESLADETKDNKLLLDLELDKYGDAYLPLHYFIIENGETVYKGIAE